MLEDQVVGESGAAEPSGSAAFIARERRPEHVVPACKLRWPVTKRPRNSVTSSTLELLARPAPAMLKSNVIAVDFRPQVRNTNIDELDAELEAIDAALEAAHSRARVLEAQIRPLAGTTSFPMRWCRRDPLP